MTEAGPEANRIERDLEHTRSRLDATIDALQQKLSPGEMFEQTLGYLKESGGGEFGRNLLVSVRDNPMPVALTAIGLAWLMLSGSRKGDDDYRRTEGDTGVASGLGRGHGAAYAAGVERYPARDERWEESYHSTHGAYASAAIEDLATKANEAGSGVRREPNETEDAYQERVYAAKGGVLGLRRNTDETHSTFRERVDAAVAAAAQRYERMREQARTMTDDLAARGQSTMQNVYERGRQAAGGAYDYGQSAAGAAYGYGYGAVRNVREHPLPYLLIGAGVAWLLMANRGDDEDEGRYGYERARSRYYGSPGRYAGYEGAGYGRSAGGAGYERAGYDYAGQPVDDLPGRAYAAGASVQRQSEESDEAYHGRVYEAKGRVMGLARDMGETLSGFRERVDSALAAAAERYRGWRDQARERGGDLASRGRGVMSGLYGTGGRGVGYVQEQPLLLGAVGAAIGAGLAMLIPPSRYERQMMAGVGEDVRERMREAASEAMHGASRVAREAMGAARESADREGLSGDYRVGGLAHVARERVHDAAERARHVVEETAAAARESAERELKGGERGSNGKEAGETRQGSTSQGGGYGPATGGNGDNKRTPA